MDRKQLGSKGESLAAEFLIKKGYKVMKRNLRGKSGEIDLLCLHENIIVLVEVKTQQSDAIDPIFKVDQRKQRKLRMLAKQVASKNPGHYVRIDVITIVMNQGPAIIHLENVLG